MLNQQEILKLILYQMPAGEIVNLDDRTGEVLDIIVRAGAMKEEYVNLFKSAPVMFKTLEYVLQAFKSLLASLKMSDNKDAILPFQTLHDSVAMTMDAVLRGVDVVSQEIREKKNLN